MTRQKSAVLQVWSRFSLRVQQALDALDDLIATGQEEVEKFDVCLKRRNRFANHNALCAIVRIEGRNRASSRTRANPKWRVQRQRERHAPPVTRVSRRRRPALLAAP